MMYLPKIKHVLPALILFSLLQGSCFAKWYSADRAIMGTNIHVELWHTNPSIAQQGINAVIAEMHRIDELMSPYKPKSELSKINTHATDAPVIISHELFQLIKKSLAISALSKGAFDITFASVGHMYKYREKLNPSDEQIRTNLHTINYKNIRLDNNKHSIYLAKKGMRIDLGGIAKGHAVDNSISILSRLGIKMAMVSAGGDTRLLGDKQGRPWLVGIKKPRLSNLDKKNTSAIVLPLSQSALSTSGDYERYFIKDNVRHHHIINPSTGKSARSVQSVTIIGNDATTTDALSTTVFILGVKKGMELISRLTGIEAIIIDAQNKVHYSSGLNRTK